MTEQEKEFAKELVEDLIDAATDYGYQEGVVSFGGVVRPADREREQLAVAAEKLYTWIANIK
jgi:predicted sugar kinase